MIGPPPCPACVTSTGGYTAGGWGGAWGRGEMRRKGSFSHGGATGILVGADPDTGLSCPVFITQPGAPLHRIATAVQAAITD